MSDLRTKAGLAPATKDEKPFEITTAKAEEYLQDRFNSIVGQMRKNGDKQEDVEIQLLSFKCSKKMVPFALILPLSTLKNGYNKKKNVKELDMFNPQETSSVAKLKDPFFNLVCSLNYSKKDENAFFNGTFRREVGLSLQEAHFLKANRMPRVQENGKNRSNDYVMCIIDPARLFHDMLTNLDNRGESFGIADMEAEKIDSKNFLYSMLRVTKKKGKGKKKKDADDILRDIGRALNTTRR